MNVYNYKNRMREVIIISDDDYLTKRLQMSLFLRFNLCCQLELCLALIITSFSFIQYILILFRVKVEH